MTTASDSFHLEEYKALRAEILLLKQQNFDIQKWVIVTLGVIYSVAYGVAASFTPKMPIEILFFAAFITWLFGAFLYQVSDYTIYSIAAYLEKIEERFADGGGLCGWEHRHGRPTGRQPIREVFRSPFWWFGLVATIGVPILHLFGIDNVAK